MAVFVSNFLASKLCFGKVKWPLKSTKYTLTHYAMYAMNIYADLHTMYMLSIYTDVYTAYMLMLMQRIW